MLTIYHNTRCSKSRSALQILEEQSIPNKVRFYLQEPLSKEELKDLLNKLGMQPSALLRKGEAIYKEYKDQPLTEGKWLALMVERPQLIERPIVVNGHKALVARPPERVLEMI